MNYFLSPTFSVNYVTSFPQYRNSSFNILLNFIEALVHFILQLIVLLYSQYSYGDLSSIFCSLTFICFIVIVIVIYLIVFYYNYYINIQLIHVINLRIFISFSIMPKGRPLNRKDKQKLRQQHRRQLEQAKIDKEKQMARREIRKLQDTGIVEAYESFLRSICRFGLPEPRNVYEMAAQHVLKHEKKMKQKKQKKDMIMQYNSAALKASSPEPQQKILSPHKNRY